MTTGDGYIGIPFSVDPARPAVRVTLSRRRGWKMPANTVKVCRPGFFGNPFKIGDKVQGTIIDGTQAVELYKLAIGPAFSERARRELRGKNLACWCKPGAPCHADVLLKIANG